MLTPIPPPTPPTSAMPSSRQAAGMLRSPSGFRWEYGALIGILLGMMAMIGMLLWPQPHATLTLTPYRSEAIPQESALAASSSLPENPAELESVSSDKTEEAGVEPGTSRQQRHARSSHVGHLPKPKHPPVLNLNTASVTQLELLPGIGPKMALRIVAYRQEHGPFRETAQVMEVKGIGEKKFEKMKPFLKI